MRSNAYRLLVSCEQAPRAQYPLTITYNSKLSVRLTKNSLRLQKSVPLHSTLKKVRGESEGGLFLGAKRFFVRDAIPFFFL